VISVTDRTAHIASVRDLARKVAGLYLEIVAGAGEDESVIPDVTRTDDNAGDKPGDEPEHE